MRRHGIPTQKPYFRQSRPSILMTGEERNVLEVKYHHRQTSRLVANSIPAARMLSTAVVARSHNWRSPIAGMRLPVTAGRLCSALTKACFWLVARDSRNVMKCQRRVNKCVQKLRPLPPAVPIAVAFLPKEVVCASVRGLLFFKTSFSCVFPLSSVPYDWW